jgi:Ca-activated chloride channel family protein
MRRFLVLAAVCLTAALALRGVGAQSGAGQIRGVVTDGSGPVAGAEVKVTNGGLMSRSTRTDARGEFQFTDLAAGQYSVTVTMNGFLTLSQPIAVAAGATERRTFTLVREPKQRAMREVHAEAAAARRAGIAGGFVGELSVATYPASMDPRGAPWTGFNTEGYDKIDDNQWTEVARKPLSTFSIDVDTASYSNVRRFLNQGQAPPKDAVRIEELINYFSYEYPEPADDKPFSVTTALDECPWNPRHRLVLVGLQAKHLDSSRLPPRNLVFLIDVSGSMMPANKLPLVKSSLAMLARNLTSKDRLAIVVYAGAAGVVLPSTPGSDTSTILEALARLQAGGSTNGAQGIQLAYDLAQQQFVKGGVNRVMLATDGDFNVGVTNQGDLIRLIEEKRASGIMLSVLGYGMGNVKDSTMEKLADKGNGNYFYIDTLAEAQKVLVQQAGGTLVTVAKDVKLQVEFNPRTVAAYRLVGYENRVLQDRDFNDDRRDAGDMGAGHSVTALYEIAPVGEKLDIPGIDPLKYQTAPNLSDRARLDEAMTVKLRYKQPEAAESTLLSVTVPTTIAPNPVIGFAAAVAQFGMLLRDSEFKGSASFASTRALATTFKGSDPHGHRAEFVRLIDLAENVTAGRGTR